MTLTEYIHSIEEDIAQLHTWEEEISPLDCCDNRELEVLENVLEALKTIEKETG